MSRSRKLQVIFAHACYDSVIFFVFLGFIFFLVTASLVKLSRAALRPLLAAHKRGALPLVGAAWGVTARKAIHRRSPPTRAEPCHWSERRGVSLRESRATMQVMPGVSLRARWDATLVIGITESWTNNDITDAE